MNIIWILVINGQFFIGVLHFALLLERHHALMHWDIQFFLILNFDLICSLEMNDCIFILAYSWFGAPHFYCRIVRQQFGLVPDVNFLIHFYCWTLLLSSFDYTFTLMSCCCIIVFICLIYRESDKVDEDGATGGSGKKQLRLSNVGITTSKRKSEEIESNAKGRCKFFQARKLEQLSRFWIFDYILQLLKIN